MSDEVKDGTIQNEYFIRNLTATEAYIRLKIEQQQKTEIDYGNNTEIQVCGG